MTGRPLPYSSFPTPFGGRSPYRTAAGGGGGGSGFEAETLAVLAAYTVEPDGATQILMNDIVVELKTRGMWALLDTFYVMATNEDAGARVNWINPGTFDLVDVGTPSFVVDEGYDFNGTDNQLDTGYNLSTSGGNYLRNSASAGFWTGHTGQLASSCFGAYPSGGPGVSIGVRHTTDVWVTRANCTTACLSRAPNCCWRYWTHWKKMR